MNLNSEISHLKRTIAHLREHNEYINDLTKTLNSLEEQQNKKDEENIETLRYIVADGKNKFNELDDTTKNVILFFELILDIIVRLKES